MPVLLNNLVNQWFTQKQVDTDGNGSISRDEMAVYTNNASLKPYAQQSWEEALGGQMIKSANGNGGESFFSILSQLDGVAGLSESDVSKLANLDGNAADITGADFKKFDQLKAPASKPVAPQIFNLEYGDTDYAVKFENGHFTAQANGEDLEVTFAENGHAQTVADGKLWDLGLVVDDGDGTYSIDEFKEKSPVDSKVADYKLNYNGVDYNVTQHSNGTFTAQVGDEDLPISLKDDGTVVLTANGGNHDLGKIKEDGDGTYSIQEVA